MSQRRDTTVVIEPPGRPPIFEPSFENPGGVNGTRPPRAN